MTDQIPPTLPVADLRVGVFVMLELGWLDHPFPFSSFKISSQQQIETLRNLGLTQVRWDPHRSDPPLPATAPGRAPTPNTQAAPMATGAAAMTPEEQQRLQQLAALQAQRQSLQQCEKRYAEGTRAYRHMVDSLNKDPASVLGLCSQIVGGMVQDLFTDEESAIRLLSDGQGERAALHAMNVTVLSLLLGKAMGLERTPMEALGLAALLHDIGKTALPDRVRYRDDSFTAAHHKLYQEHIAHGVALGRDLGLSPLALLTLSQHHEMADGSGFPSGCSADRMMPTSRILALINRYDGLCNPPNPLKALTPHESLSQIFVSHKDRFEGQTLKAFIHMMGIYPPGSLVQLTDERYALVVSVNSSRPLKPRVLVHERGVRSEEALLLDLQQNPTLGVQRSLRVDQLPRAALDFLSPRQRVCYYFERAISPGPEHHA